MPRKCQDSIISVWSAASYRPAAIATSPSSGLLAIGISGWILQQAVRRHHGHSNRRHTNSWQQILDKMWQQQTYDTVLEDGTE